MKHLARAIALLFFLAVAAYAQEESGATSDPAIATAAESSREILLTFTDRSLARTDSTRPGQYYRRGGNYQAATWARSIAADIARDYPLITVVEWPIRALNVHCVVYRVDDAQSVDSVIAQLQSDSRVKSAQRMNTFRALGSEDPYKPLQTAFNDMHFEEVHQWTTGAGIRIAIVDTGVDVNHPDLAGQVTERFDLTDSGLNFEDDIHGTAIAGIIGALSDNGVGIEGIAPDAHLLALRACWPERSGGSAADCNSLSLARALDTAIFLKPDIINLSLTGPPDPLIEDLLTVAQRAGIIIVVAVPEASSPPGFIAGIDGIIRARSGGAQDVALSGPDRVAAIVAPGRDVLTTFPHGTYNFVSGNSFAAANVSGIIALLLQLQPGLTPQRVENLLRSGMGGATAEGKTPGISAINACQIAAQLQAGLVCADSTFQTARSEIFAG